MRFNSCISTTQVRQRLHIHLRKLTLYKLKTSYVPVQEGHWQVLLSNLVILLVKRQQSSITMSRLLALREDSGQPLSC